MTYEDIFYRPFNAKKAKISGGGGQDSRTWQRTGATAISSEPLLKIYGFATRGCPYCQSNLKGHVLDRGFSAKPVNNGQKINIVHYIGIAADEPKRIERHIKCADKVLPLVQIGWDEALCGLEATYLDMLAPTYTDGSLRDGCWFCHNQGVDQLRNLRKKYPDLWALLMKWDTDSPVTFHADGHTVHDFDRRFALEDEGIIKTDEPFKWANIEEPQLRWF